MTPPAPQPVYFGTGLFGWLHRPGADAEVDIGLVICNPFGFEEVCAHRSLRALAIAAACAGIPTLRFDYAGCGNSAGDEFEADMLGRWLGSVHEAVDGLKQASGVRQVCLLGLRLGAALATLAAKERSDVPGLVLIAPVVRGRAYVRELIALAGTGTGESIDVLQPGMLESAGFTMSDETRAALATVDLRALERAPAGRTLIVERDDLPSDGTWPALLERLGSKVTVASWRGYARMMDDPQRALVPEAIFEGVLRELARWRVTGEPAVSADVQWGSNSQLIVADAAAPSASLLDTAVQIDTGQTTLFGVLTRLAGEPRPISRAVLMLTAGSVHAIGPNRLWVRLARRWAAHGMLVLRLDVSGIGDSAAHPGSIDNVVYSPHALDDIDAAVKYLKSQRCIGECHLMGLCSGAYHAFKAAVAGHAVASAIIINPLTYSWKEGDQLSDVKEYEVFPLTSKYRGKFLTLDPWRRLVKGELDLRQLMKFGLRRARLSVESHATGLARLLRIPVRNSLVHELSSATRNDVKLRFLFSSDAPGFALLRKRSGGEIERLQASDLATLDFVDGADHTFTRMQARERLIQTLERRIEPGRGVGNDAT